MEELVKRLEAAVKALESKGKGGSAGGDSSNAIELPPLDDFNALINEF